MHFDGVTEQLCKVSSKRLKKFIECRAKWVKYKCQQGEIAKKSYDLFDDSSVNSYLERNPKNIDLEWYHHMKCYKKFCDEDKIRRQEKKEEKEACASIAEHMEEHENEESRVETIEPQRKLARKSLAESNTSGNAPQRNKYVLAEKCIICGRDSSWFYEDKVFAIIIW